MSAPALGLLRVVSTSAVASVNDRPACSRRSGRASPTCQALTVGGGNARGLAMTLSAEAGAATLAPAVVNMSASAPSISARRRA